MSPSHSVREIDIARADERELGVLAALIRMLEAERVPEDPPVPVAAIVDRLRGRPDARHRDWIAMDDQGPVAHAMLRQARDGDALRRDVVLEVIARRRRKGIGRALLERIVAAAGHDEEIMLFANTSDRVPSGRPFAERIGAQPALDNIGLQLDLRTVDPELLDSWSSVDPPGYELVWIDGPTPSRLLENVISAYQSMLDTRPRGSLRLERVVVDADILRTLPWGDTAIRAGRERRMLLAIHRATGATAGFTEVSRDRRIPFLVSQAGTGVAPAHRGADIAKWLKARMLARVLSDWPDARIMRTGNASSNVPMLSLNRRLGFTQVWTVTNWQLTLAGAGRYVGGQRRSGSGMGSASQPP